LQHVHLTGKTGNLYTRSLTWYRIPMAVISEFLLLLQPFILVYVIAWSIVLHTISMFVGAYIMLTLYTLWTIFPDEHSTWRHKLGMSAYAPFLYFTFYIMDLIQIVSLVRCLAHPRQLLRRSDHNATWVSPERAGQAVQFS